mmetsp:Transcript_26520/g.84067  ORF Transcript_26520/g.84067 Transcript_26520/m.84067 type:complete len:594 (+) Transcript_26520:79-1860(+)
MRWHVLRGGSLQLVRNTLLDKGSSCTSLLRKEHAKDLLSQLFLDAATHGLSEEVLRRQHVPQVVLAQAGHELGARHVGSHRQPELLALGHELLLFHDGETHQIPAHRVGLKEADALHRHANVLVSATQSLHGELPDEARLLLVLVALALEVALDLLAALQGVHLQVEQRQRLPDQHHLQVLEHGGAVRAGLPGQAPAGVGPLQVLVAHAGELVVLPDELAHGLEVPDALGLETTLLPSVHALLLQELRHQELALIVLVAHLPQILDNHLVLHALLRQLRQGQCLPHCHGLNELQELLLRDVLVLRAAGALVPLDQVLCRHLVDGLVLLHQLHGRLVATKAPHGQTLRLEFQLVVQPLPQALKHRLAAVTVWKATLAAVLLELAQRQGLPDEHVAEAIHGGLHVQLRVVGDAHSSVLGLQGEGAHDLQMVDLFEQLIGELRATQALGRDATSLAAVVPHDVDQLLVELLPCGLLSEVPNTRGEVVGLALAQELVRRQGLPNEGLLQLRLHGVGGGARGQAVALAVGHELVRAGDLQAADLHEDGFSILLLGDPCDWDAGLLPRTVLQQLKQLLSRLLHQDVHALLCADLLEREK